MTSNHFFSFRVLWNRAQILSSWLSNTQKRLVSGKKVWKLLAKEFYYLFIYLFIWLLRVLVVACGIFVAVCGIFSCSMWALSCGMWDVVP